MLIHSSIEGHSDYLHLLSAVNIGRQYLLESQLVSLLGTYPEVDLLDGVSVLCLIFGGAIIQFLTVSAAIYIPTSNAQRCQFLQPFSQEP